MSAYPEYLEDLMDLLKSMPGVGRRAAERMALAMLHWAPEKIQTFGTMIHDLPERVGFCPECGSLALAGERCSICTAPERDQSTICVVEEPQQIFAIEKSGLYRGLYHVLGGRLSPINGINGEQLNLPSLLRRTAEGKGVREVILALSSDVEGRATTIYVAELLKQNPVKVSQPALGLPAGGNLSYADGATIRAALSGRHEVN